jgi:hypothetical protein
LLDRIPHRTNPTASPAPASLGAATKNALAGRARAFSLPEQVKRPADQGRVWKFVETCKNREIFIQNASHDERAYQSLALRHPLLTFI